MSQPIHTGPRQIDGNLKANWLPLRDEQCWACEGSGRQLVRWVADRIYFGAPTDEICDECGGSGRADEPDAVPGDEQWIDHDALPDYLQDGDR